ncbi:helix-turn-helix transcriptional regulator [Vagococcus sp.]|uniref:helix-turn-helix transcriptional regulator n=1 Tax=Vagococcus sp. TaxID=1933889 RepID=UPI003F993436
MSENYLILTETDKIILNSYNTLIDHLGNYLGDGYEIILHSLENLDQSVINIYNSDYSNRKVGSPITDLALSMLETLNTEGTEPPLTYFNINQSGTRMKSCTIPVKGENDRIIGLICMNFYMNTTIEMMLKKLSPLDQMMIENQPITETYSDTSEELICRTVKRVQQEIFQNSAISQQNKNKEIIKNLNDKGIFNLKDGVIQAADTLGISKNTVYMHLRKLKTKK